MLPVRYWLLLALSLVIFYVLDTSHVLNAVPDWVIYTTLLIVVMVMIIKHYWFDTKESQK
jgi:hypothetical protein